MVNLPIPAQVLRKEMIFNNGGVDQALYPFGSRHYTLSGPDQLDELSTMVSRLGTIPFRVPTKLEIRGHYTLSGPDQLDGHSMMVGSEYTIPFRVPTNLMNIIVS